VELTTQGKGEEIKERRPPPFKGEEIRGEEKVSLSWWEGVRGRGLCDDFCKIL